MKESHERRSFSDCLACVDPEQLPGWLTSERARADELAEKSRESRAAAEEAEKRYLDALIADEHWKIVAAAQGEHRLLCGEANAYAQSAGMIRAHANRVEAAHPAREAVAP